MTQEEKDLILKYLDLCARVPHDVKVQYMNNIFVVDYISSYKEVKLDVPDNYTVGISEVKPYLFPLSSLTEEQRNSISHLLLDTQNEFPPYGELNTKGCDNLFVTCKTWCKYENGEAVEGYLPNMPTHFILIPKAPDGFAWPYNKE